MLDLERGVLEEFASAARLSPYRVPIQSGVDELSLWTKTADDTPGSMWLSGDHSSAISLAKKQMLAELECRSKTSDRSERSDRSEILCAINESDGVQSLAAKRLGVSRKYINYWAKVFGIKRHRRKCHLKGKEYVTSSAARLGVSRAFLLSILTELGVQKNTVLIGEGKTATCVDPADADMALSEWKARKQSRVQLSRYERIKLDPVKYEAFKAKARAISAARYAAKKAKDEAVHDGHGQGDKAFSGCRD